MDMEKDEHTRHCYTCGKQEICPYKTKNAENADGCPFYEHDGIDVPMVKHMIPKNVLEEKRDALSRAIDYFLMEQSDKLLNEMTQREGALDPYSKTKLEMELLKLKGLDILNGEDSTGQQKIQVLKELNKQVDQNILLEGLSKETAGKNVIMGFYKSFGMKNKSILKEPEKQIPEFVVEEDDEDAP